MELVEVICAGCQQPFLKPKKEYNHRLRQGAKRFFCKTSCQVQLTNFERAGFQGTLAEKNAQIELKCAECQQPFFKPRREYDRQVRKGRTTFFCCGSCHMSHRHKTHPQPRSKNLRNGATVDKLSPFRWFVLRARQRVHKGVTDIDAKYLLDLWDQQMGRCPLTGWDLILPRNSGGWPMPDPANASLDRVNNAKGYVRGNVRFVSLMANLARGRFSDVELKEFCKAVACRCNQSHDEI